MRQILTVPALVLAALCPAAGFAAAAPPIKAAEFPAVSKRAAFFEERINADKPATRLRVLTEVTYFFTTPDPESTAFLKRLMRDPDPVVRGRAILSLHDRWVPIDRKELPQRFTGYHDGQLIDLEKKETIPDLLRQCDQPSAQAGYAAYVLGLLRHRDAVPQLKKLANHPNIFVRYAAARALLDCGDRAAARPILEAIVRSQLEQYAAGPAPVAGRDAPVETQPYYAAVGCRALMELGPRDKAVGLEKMIALLGYLERSPGPNDQANIPFVEQLLADAAGKYFPSSTAARKWYAEKYPKGPASAPPQP
jgi:hypothetical protein